MKLLAKNLGFGYEKGKKIFDGVTIEAHSGRCLFLLGRNGVGKTTLLNCLGGIVEGEGSLSVVKDDKSEIDLLKLKPKERAKIVGYVPQTVVFPPMSVFDAVLTGRLPYIKWGISKEDIRISEDIIERLSLTDIAMRNVLTLSGGEKQKTAIARALAQKAGILLLDEPTSNLDVKNQINVLEFLRQTTRENNLITVAVVHDLQLAVRFADDIVLLKQGKVYAACEASRLSDDDIKQVFDIDAEIIKDNGKYSVLYK